jgi:hypothetical protein
MTSEGVSVFLHFLKKYKNRQKYCFWSLGTGFLRACEYVRKSKQNAQFFSDLEVCIKHYFSHVHTKMHVHVSAINWPENIFDASAKNCTSKAINMHFYAHLYADSPKKSATQFTACKATLDILQH